MPLRGRLILIIVLGYFGGDSVVTPSVSTATGMIGVVAVHYCLEPRLRGAALPINSHLTFLIVSYVFSVEVGLGSGTWLKDLGVLLRGDRAESLERFL